MKKKFLLLIGLLFVLVGCGTLMNTPTKQVEELLAKYQKADSDITREIDTMLLSYNMTENEKKDYANILKHQYQNLVYVIKDETIDNNNAVVEVEIEVLDYKKALSEVNATSTDSDYNQKRLKALKEAKDKVTYTLNINCYKDNDNNWHVSNLSSDNVKKIEGMY